MSSLQSNSSYLPVVATQQSVTQNQLFDASILAGQLAPSSIAMYTRDFAAYIDFSQRSCRRT
jgi:hypothetical protein